MRDWVQKRPWVLTWAASTLFGVALLYALLFALHDDGMQECKSRNLQVQEVNERVDELNGLADSLEVIWFARVNGDPSIVAEGEQVAKRALRSFQAVELSTVPLTDCASAHPHPWPFD